MIPETDLIGVTVVLIVCSYNEQEFVRIGYYVNNEYEDPELRENPPEKLDLNIITRNILSEKPRVTRVPIRWDSLDEIPEPLQDDEDHIDSFNHEFVTEDGLEGEEDTDMKNNSSCFLGEEEQGSFCALKEMEV